MVDARQLRAARALLEWSQSELAERTGLSLTTIKRMESSAVGPDRSSFVNLRAVLTVFDAAGVQFIGESGVQLGSDGMVAD